MTRDLSVEIVGDVMVATIDRPDKHNAIGGTLLRDVLEASWECEQDDRLGAFVVTGRGANWCAGGDVDGLQGGFGPGAKASWLVHRGGMGGDMGLPPLSDAEVLFDGLGVGAWAPLYLRCSKPLIAGINGPAVGGGFALSLLHDFRIASDKAFFLPAFAGLGVGPELGASWFLPRIVGLPHATRLLLSGGRVSAEEALRIGLVNEVVSPDRLQERVIEFAQAIAALPRDVVRSTMLALRATSSSNLRRQLARENRNREVVASNRS